MSTKCRNCWYSKQATDKGYFGDTDWFCDQYCFEEYEESTYIGNLDESLFRNLDDDYTNSEDK